MITERHTWDLGWSRRRVPSIHSYILRILYDIRCVGETTRIVHQCRDDGKMTQWRDGRSRETARSKVSWHYLATHLSSKSILSSPSSRQATNGAWRWENNKSYKDEWRDSEGRQIQHPGNVGMHNRTCWQVQHYIVPKLNRLGYNLKKKWCQEKDVRSFTTHLSGKY